MPDILGIKALEDPSRTKPDEERFTWEMYYQYKDPGWKRLRRENRIKWIGLGRTLTCKHTCNYCFKGSAFIYVGPYFNNDSDWNVFICTSCGWRKCYRQSQTHQIQEDFPEHYRKHLIAKKAMEEKKNSASQNLQPKSCSEIKKELRAANVEPIYKRQVFEPIQQPQTLKRERHIIKIIVTLSKKKAKEPDAGAEKAREAKEFEKFQRELKAEVEKVEKRMKEI